MFDPEGKAEIFIPSTNQFRMGEKDQYALAGASEVTDGKFLIEGIDDTTGFFKYWLQQKITRLTIGWFGRIEKKQVKTGMFFSEVAIPEGVSGN